MLREKSSVLPVEPVLCVSRLFSYRSQVSKLNLKLGRIQVKSFTGRLQFHKWLVPIPAFTDPPARMTQKDDDLVA